MRAGRPTAILHRILFHSNFSLNVVSFLQFLKMLAATFPLTKMVSISSLVCKGTCVFHFIMSYSCLVTTLTFRRLHKNERTHTNCWKGAILLIWLMTSHFMPFFCLSVLFSFLFSTRELTQYYSVALSSSQGLTLTYPYYRFPSSSNHGCVPHDCIFRRTFARSKYSIVGSAFSSPGVFEFDNSYSGRRGYPDWILSTNSCPSMHIKNSHLGNYLIWSTHGSCPDSQKAKPLS